MSEGGRGPTGIPASRAPALFDRAE